MRLLRSAWGLALCVAAIGQTTATPDVGSGSPNANIQRSFVSAFSRNRFWTLVSTPPLADVKKFGTAGLVQEFQDANKTSGVKLALIDPNQAVQAGDGSDIFQVLAPMYNYYSTVGVSTAGYPRMDTATCPAAGAASCQYQLFDKNYALFAYTQDIGTGQSFATRDPFYTKWNTLGGLPAFGAATSAEQVVTSVNGGNATRQTFASGAIYNITSGALTGRIVAILEPVWDVYVANGGHAGFLGFPLSEPVLLSGGKKRQSFEGGSIDFDPSSGAVLRVPVARVGLTPAGSTIRMNSGDTLMVTATAYANDGSILSDRAITFTTSNGSVVSVQPSGSTAVLKAIGGGVASVTAVSEGKTSGRLTVIVTAPCCQIGEGAPTAAVQQIFVDTVTRNRLAVHVPSGTPVRRVNAGYVQELQAASADNPARYLIAVPDKAAVGFLVTGSLLDAYESLGGAAGVLGYPTADAVYDRSGVPRQLFEHGALAGKPVASVMGGILARWAALRYDAGAAGMPAGDAGNVLSFTGISGVAQAFEGGTFVEASSGVQRGKVFFVSGLIQSKYASSGGPGGDLGFPIADEAVADGKRSQDFEGGTLSYTPGDAEAALTARARKPTVTVTPATPVAGTRVHIIIGGFANGAAIRVSVSGQPDFTVQTTSGSFVWDAFVPAGSAGTTVTVRAADAASAGATASATFAVKASSDVAIQLTKFAGDMQTGAPGGTLPQALQVVLRDNSGNALAGVPVRFTASPGASIVNASAVTDSAGVAQAYLRLPASEGIVLANAEAGKQLVTFSASAAHVSLANFVNLPQRGDQLMGAGGATIAQKGSLIAAAASILRFLQTRGDAPMPNGLADPGILNDFLSHACGFDAQGTQACDGYFAVQSSQEQFADPWRIAAFAGPNLDVSIAAPDINTVRDLLSGGSPVLLGLALTRNGVPAGAHFVDATGVAADGSIVISDPNAQFGRASLTDYLNGFTTGAGAWKGTLAAALQFVARPASQTAFVVAGSAGAVSVASAEGECGSTVELPDVIATADGASLSSGVFRFRYCDGASPSYEIALSGSGPLSATAYDLAVPGNVYELGGSSPVFRASRPGTQLVVSAAQALLTANGVVNAATFTADIAPGGLIAIFGEALSEKDEVTTVEVSGRPARMVSASPFQLNVQLPPDLPAGTHVLRVNSPFGVAESTMDVQAVAPEIFRLDPRLGGAGRGAIVNADGKINLPTAPAARGSTILIFGTGFGATDGQTPARTTATVTAVVGGQELPVAFAGLTPGFVGLYQVNLTIPAAMAPGLDTQLSLRESGVESQRVLVAVQ